MIETKRERYIRLLKSKADLDFVELSFDAIKEIIELLEEPLPNSSESPNGWIPCTPGTMPEDEFVLISKKPTKISGDKWNVTIAMRTADQRSRKIQWRDIGFGVIQDDKVLAWMPLPPVYRGEEK